MRNTIKKYQNEGDSLSRLKKDTSRVIKKVVAPKSKKDVDLSAPGKGMMEQLQKKGAMPASGIKKKFKGGGKEMLTRADGTKSRRGLWDNIRAAAKRNKAAGRPGKKPTAAMLKQERKIKAKGK